MRWWWRWRERWACWWGDEIILCGWCQLGFATTHLTTVDLGEAGFQWPFFFLLLLLLRLHDFLLNMMVRLSCGTNMFVPPFLLHGSTRRKWWWW